MKKIFMVVLLLLSCQLPSAYAAGVWKVSSTSVPSIPTGTIYSSNSAACDAALAQWTATHGAGWYVEYIGDQSNGYCRIGGQYIQFHITYDSTYVPQTESCQAAGTVYGHGTEAYSSGLSLNVCDNGCGATASGAMKVGDKYIVFGPMTSTGKCTPPTTPPPIPNDRCSYRGPTGQCEAACPSGSTYRMVPTGAMACVKTAPDTPEQPKDTTCPRGYINISAVAGQPNCAPTGGLGNMNPSGPANCPAGQQSTSLNGGASYCVFTKNDQQPADTSTTKTPEASVTNPDGSVTKTTQTTTTNRDGSTTTTTTKTTTGTDGKVTTTTGDVTTKTPGGKEGVSDGKPEDKFDLCKTNPNLNICKNSSIATVVGSDGCVSSTCEGDAITCALLRQQQKEYCEATKPIPQSALGTSLLSGSDPMQAQIDAAKTGAAVDLASQSFDQSGFAPSACFGNKSGSHNGHSIPFEFTSACNAAGGIRMAVLALCSLVGFLIVARSISQG